MARHQEIEGNSPDLFAVFPGTVHPISSEWSPAVNLISMLLFQEELK
jgi:hypothetical protein